MGERSAWRSTRLAQQQLPVALVGGGSCRRSEPAPRREAVRRAGAVRSFPASGKPERRREARSSAACRDAPRVAQGRRCWPTGRQPIERSFAWLTIDARTTTRPSSGRTSRRARGSTTAAPAHRRLVRLARGGRPRAAVWRPSTGPAGEGVLVLDDFHLLESDDCHDSVMRCVELAPRGVQVRRSRRGPTRRCRSPACRATGELLELRRDGPRSSPRTNPRSSSTSPRASGSIADAVADPPRADARAGRPGSISHTCRYGRAPDRRGIRRNVRRARTGTSSTT